MVWCGGVVWWCGVCVCVCACMRAHNVGVGVGVHVYTVGVMGKLSLLFSVHHLNSVHRSRKRRSPFSSHPAGQPFSDQTASDIIGYSLSNNWNVVCGMPAIGTFLPSDRIAVRLAAPDINAISRRLLIS